MTEEQAAFQYLGDVLKANDDVAALVGARVHRAEAPQNATFPYIIFNLQSPGNDRNRPGADGRMMSRALWLIKAVTKGSASSGFAAADAIAAAIDAALVGSTGQVTSGDQTFTILSIFRTGPVAFLEKADSIRYHHAGGLYRIQVTRL